jgi:RNA polymerase sigma factor for flagellar operon FliA
MARLPASVQVDDLVQNGMLGLLDAIGRFEAQMGAQFEVYAAQRVRGAMLDGCARTTGCRAACVATRGVSKPPLRNLNRRMAVHRPNRSLLTALGMALADYQQMLQDARGHQLVYLEDMVSERGEEFP